MEPSLGLVPPPTKNLYVTPLFRYSSGMSMPLTYQAMPHEGLPAVNKNTLFGDNMLANNHQLRSKNNSV